MASSSFQLPHLLVALLLAVGLIGASASPQDHLAPVPQASKEETEVIGLLELGAPGFSSSTVIELPLYNPTRYLLKSCTVRVQIPSRGINRIYSSDAAEIKPNTDGGFSIRTGIIGVDAKDMKVEILKLTYEPVKK